MSEQFIGEIRMFGGNFAPVGWMFCEGQLLPIAESEALFQLIGTTYGGDGQETFALPDLRGRLPLHQGDGFVLGAPGGAEQVTLTTTHVPAHSHAFVAAGGVRGDQTSPAQNLPAQSFNVVPYINDGPTGTFNPAAISSSGGSQPHDNRQPFLCVSFIIALFGIFPSPT